MKLELIKESKYGRPPWYYILIDGETYTGSGIQSLIEAQYEEIKNSPDIIKIKTEILRSEEIVVPLEEI